MIHDFVQQVLCEVLDVNNNVSQAKIIHDLISYLNVTHADCDF